MKNMYHNVILHNVYSNSVRRSVNEVVPRGRHRGATVNTRVQNQMNRVYILLLLLSLFIITTTRGGMAIRYTSSGFVCVLI